MRSFRTAVASCKQRERCAVCFSLQAFEASLTREGLLCYRNLGVDVNLAGEPQWRPYSDEEMDGRKNAYLTNCLLAFPLQPHWLIETQHGFHAVFRILPQRSAAGIRAAARINHRLIRALRGNADAPLVTQLCRVPGTYQYKDPAHPFLCRLLLDNASAINPYSLEAVGGALDRWEKVQGKEGGVVRSQAAPVRERESLQSKLAGAGSVAAASAAERIIGRMPRAVWDTAGWSELREWNRNTLVPLAEPELRSLFDSVARGRGRMRDNPSPGWRRGSVSRC